MLKEQLTAADKIVICGAGTVANMMYLYLQELHLEEKVICFAVSRRDNNPDKKNGLRVVEIAKLNCVEQVPLCLIATQKVVQKEIEKELNLNGFFHVLQVDATEIQDSFYEIYAARPIVTNKILFSNMKGLGYGGNPKYIAQKLIEIDKDKILDMVWVVADGASYTFPKEIRTVRYGSLEYYAEMTTAHIWIDNVRKGADVKKRVGQYYIQTWHGAAPMKKVEKDALQSLPKTYVDNAKHDSEMADLFLSGSIFYTKLYRKSFWYEGEIMKVGLPRQDIFWHTQEVRRKVENYYQIEEKTGIALYAPTFRADFDMCVYDLDMEKVRVALENRFSRKFIFMVGKHPNNRYLQYPFSFNEHCIDIENHEDFQEILAASDVLITDYSGCVYDFSFTGRPVFLYQRDLESYIAERDFYIAMDKLPYIKAQSNEELVQKIQDFDEVRYKQNLECFMSRMGNYDEGCAAEKVAEHVMKIIGG